MKKVILSLMIAIMATVAVKAQQIAVVSGSTTTLKRTLADAISEATASSVIYLPGGGFPIADDVIIKKKLTIIGIGHKVKGENADGYTTITGNLHFGAGSDGSAVMGCYISGNVVIGDASTAVNDILVRYCNANCVDVMNSGSDQTTVNQCYLRGISDFHGANGEFTHNIANSIYKIDNGEVAYNIFTTGNLCFGNSSSYQSESTSIIGNIFTVGCSKYTIDCLTAGNMTTNRVSPFGDDSKGLSQSNAEIFEKPSGVTPYSSYHFKEGFKEYESQYGIYVGNGFNDDALPPVPYIVNMRIPEQTDADGKLRLQVRVRAGE